MAICRSSISKQRKLHFRYHDANNYESKRVVIPLGLAFWGRAWTLASWCEMRQDFRAFRLDRIELITISQIPFTLNEKISLRAFIDSQAPK